MDRVLAIAELRIRLALRQMRGGAGAARLVGALLFGLILAVAALGLAAGLAAFVYGAAHGVGQDLVQVSLLVAFYSFFFVGIVLPLLTGVLDEGLDVSPLRIFPIGRSKLFAVQLIACLGNPEHVFYYPALVAVTSVAVLANGASAIPALFLAGCALLINVIWGNALALFLSGIMRRRKVKEIVTIVALAVLIGLSVLPALLDSDEERLALSPILERALTPLVRVASALPPSLVAKGFAGLQGGSMAMAARSAAGLLLWSAVGLAVGYRMLARYHPGDGGRAREKPRRMATQFPGAGRGSFDFDHAIWGFLPIQVRAVASKDLRYLFRSVAGKFGLLVAPVLVAVAAMFVGEVIERPVLGMDPSKVLLLGMLVYALLFSSNMINNAFAWEAEGAKAYFTSPVGLQSVLAGKNLAIWIYNAVLLGICLAAWFVLTGLPDPLTLIVALQVFAFALLACTCVGNVLSVLFPVRRDMSAMKNHPAQAAVLLSMLALVVIGAVTSVLLAIPLLAGAEALQPVSLLVALALLSVFYRGALGLTARLLLRRRDRFLEALKSAR